jgi:hypothetical protein
VVLGIQVIDQQADPAGDQYEDRADDLADDADGLLEDVKDGEDGKDETDNVNDRRHNYGGFKVCSNPKYRNFSSKKQRFPPEMHLIA